MKRLRKRLDFILLTGILIVVSVALLPLSHAGVGIRFNAEYIIASPDVEVCLSDTYGVYNPFPGDVKVEATITDDLTRFLSSDSPSRVEIDVPAQTSSAEFIQVPDICFTVPNSECDSIAGENGIKVIVTEIRDEASTGASGSAARTVLSADLDFRCDPGFSPDDEAGSGFNFAWLWTVLIIIIVVLIIFFVVKKNRSSVSSTGLSLS